MFQSASPAITFEPSINVDHPFFKGELVRNSVGPGSCLEDATFFDLKASSLQLSAPALVYNQTTKLLLWQYTQGVAARRFAAAKPKYVLVRHFDIRNFRPDNGKRSADDDRVRWVLDRASIRRLPCDSSLLPPLPRSRWVSSLQPSPLRKRTQTILQRRELHRMKATTGASHLRAHAPIQIATWTGIKQMRGTSSCDACKESSAESVAAGRLDEAKT
jgi:hypothetical protein